jgi:hypothetical protein
MTRIYLLAFLFLATVFQACNNQIIEIIVDETVQNQDDFTFINLNAAIEKAYQIKAENNKAEIVINIQPGRYYWQTFANQIKPLAGKKDIYLKYIGKDANRINLNWLGLNKN